MQCFVFLNFFSVTFHYLYLFDLNFSLSHLHVLLLSWPSCPCSAGTPFSFPVRCFCLSCFSKILAMFIDFYLTFWFKDKLKEDALVAWQTVYYQYIMLKILLSSTRGAFCQLILTVMLLVVDSSVLHTLQFERNGIDVIGIISCFWFCYIFFVCVVVGLKL